MIALTELLRSDIVDGRWIRREGKLEERPTESVAMFGTAKNGGRFGCAFSPVEDRDCWC